MDLIISNPAGWWALLGIPAVLIIHLLQHEARRHTVSTLFLIEHLAPLSAEGRVIERLRHSASLWLQLLAVLLLTWLLLDPRRLREDSFQRVVVLLDSSVSMRAFRDRLPDALKAALGRLDRAAAGTEWRLIETDSEREARYAGSRLADLLAALDGWIPRLGTHDFAPAVQVARGLAGADGSIVLVTDREPTDLPGGVELLAVGAPIDNVGFTGLRMQTDPATGAVTWSALVRNHGQSPQRRQWTVETGTGAAREQLLELAAGATRVLRGGFPDGQSAITLALAADAFAMDDRLPVVRPQPKRLRAAVQLDAPVREFGERFLASLSDVDRVPRSEQPDIELLSCTPGVAPPRTANAICLARADAGEPGPTPAGPVVAEAHALTDGLSWQGLLCQPVRVAPLTGDEQVLVWMGEHPLVYLGGQGAFNQLVVAFDLSVSNAARLPAFVVLLHRFVESVRARKPAYAARNLEVNQRLGLAIDPAGGGVERVADGRADPPVDPARAYLLRAPADPGLFAVRQDGGDLLFASARFADAREADFRDAAASSGVRARAGRVRRRNSRPDPFAPLWTVLALAAILTSWALPKTG